MSHQTAEQAHEPPDNDHRVVSAVTDAKAVTGDDAVTDEEPSHVHVPRPITS